MQVHTPKARNQRCGRQRLQWRGNYRAANIGVSHNATVCYVHNVATILGQSNYAAVGLTMLLHNLCVCTCIIDVIDFPVLPLTGTF